MESDIELNLFCLKHICTKGHHKQSNIKWWFIFDNLLVVLTNPYRVESVEYVSMLEQYLCTDVSLYNTTVQDERLWYLIA